MLPLTKEELKSHQDPKVCYICGKRFFKKLAKSKNYRRCDYTTKYRGTAHSICNSYLMCLMKFLQFFTMGQTTIIILS